MKILYLTSEMHPRHGGPPRVIVGQAAAICRRGHDAVIAAPVREAERQEVCAAWASVCLRGGVQRFDLYRRGLPHFTGRSNDLDAALHSTIREYDLVHIHGVWEQCLASAARIAFAHKVPYIVSPHGMLDRWSRRRSALKKAVASRVWGTRQMLTQASGMQFGSEEECSQAGEWVRIRKAYIIANGVELRDSSSPLNDLATHFPLLAGASPLLVFYSRMHPKKGVHVLLEAFSAVARRHPHAMLIIAALAEDRVYEARMRRRIEQEDLRERVVLTTECTGERGLAVMQAADIFVLPSSQEGFSIAIVEAMAAGLAVVISDQCHMNVVQQIGAGEVCSASPGELARALDKVISAGPSAWRQMGAAGREWVRKYCVWDRIGAQLEQMYCDASP